MTDSQFQHLINMLAGLQACIKFVGWAVIWHMALSGPSTSSICDAIDRIAAKMPRL